eukprot:m.124851 g.124851  ORF g.124851 m.124851 type:complete len:298 (+) comp37860_c1_seq2:70-963(+)
MSVLVAFLLLQALALVSSQNGTYVFIPSKYIVDKLQSPGHNEVRTYTANLCPAETARYDGYLATIDVNLPFNLLWNPVLGVVFVKVSNTTDFSNSFCTNVNPSGSPVRSCNFTYNKDMGSTLHFQLTAGTAGNILFTFGIEFNSTSSEFSSFPQKTFSPAPGLLPKNPKVNNRADYTQDLYAIVKLSTPGSVETTKSIHYEFSICPPTEKYEVAVNVLATDTDSAFSTYLCSSRVCVPDVPGSRVVAFDVSDSSINFVHADVDHFMPGGTVFVLITGFGGKQMNTFELGARVTPSTP